MLFSQIMCMYTMILRKEMLVY